VPARSPTRSARRSTSPATWRCPPAALAECLNVDAADLATTLAASGAVALADGGGGELYVSAAKWDGIVRAVGAAVAAFHADTPLAPGIEMEEVRTRLPQAIGAKAFRAAVERLVAAGTLTRRGSLLAAPGHRVALADADEDLAARAAAMLDAAALTPPDTKVLAATLAVPRERVQAVLGVLEKRGDVVRVAPDLYFAAAAVAGVRDVLEEHLGAHPTITAAELRDRLDISRKFAIALLDYFDRTAVTMRVGDARKLRR
jgi:selenocysteine-specific elongation factor